MHKFNKWFSSVLTKGGTALMVFPAAVAFGLFATIVRIIDISSIGTNFMQTSLLIAFLTGLISNILLVLIARRNKLGSMWTLALTGAGILLPCLAFLLPYTSDTSNMNLLYMRIIGADIIMLMIIFVVMMYKNKRFTMSELMLWLLREMLGGLFFGSVFFIATAAITGIINILFMHNMPGVIYSQLAYCSIFVVFLFSVGSLSEVFEPENSQQEQSDQTFRQAVEKITCFVLIPVILVLFVAIIIWLCKGIWWNNWPSAIEIFSRVSLLLLLSCFIFMLTLSFNNLPGRIYRIFLPSVGIPLLGIGLWRLITLVLDYGITDKRYFALIGYAFLAVCLFSILFTPRSHFMVILISAMILTVVTVMPAFNYHTVSAYSQVKRAEIIMQRNDMLEGSKITTPESISDEDRLELSRAVQYIVEVNETSLAPWLPLNFDFFEDYETVFGVQGEYNEQGESMVMSKVLVGELENKYYDIGDFDILLVNYKTYNLLNFSQENIVGNKGTYSVLFTDDAAADSVIAIVKRNGEIIAEEDITENLSAISGYLKTHTKVYGEVVSLPLSVMTINIETDQIHLRVILKSVTATLDEANKTLTTVLTDTILMKEK